ncbi:FKBP-type peptidyl-prolyl cis-trans isomerase [Rufibacter ruber]|uniref:FKBP-type peptidyl-prolyl cis-trans isomerase n=1 Tax=Rufibacter ruber TaxID=1783499 RepID=UPI0009EF4C72|nr:FKBP-type peptidyl-prolyl cis-trans isomerase [Rufibacter ruber]
MQPLVRKGLLWQWMLSICFVLAFASCNDKDPYDPYANFDAAAQAKLDDELIQSYLKTNGITDTVKTASGLYYKVIEAGDGARPVLGNKIKVHYTGKFIQNSVIFESTYASPPHEPQTFVLDTRLIKGWTEGIPMMRKGEKARLWIPSHLAYGLLGNGKIPGNTPIMFEIYLLDIL